MSQQQTTERPYDSTNDTKTHIRRVGQLLDQILGELGQRSYLHDASKLAEPEKSALDEFTPMLQGLTYGSPEYYAGLKNSGPAMDVYLKHHYAHNQHHPEYHGEKGIAGMTLVDLVEMFVDWKASTERHADGSLEKSIVINTSRFKLDPQIVAIFENTRQALGW